MADANKTEQATPRRKHKAREKGQVARSRDLSGAAATLTAILLISLLVGGWIGEWRDFFSRVLTAAAQPRRTLDVQVLLWTGIRSLKWWAPVAGLSWMVAVAAAVAQGGLVFAPVALSPKVERFNPASNLRQLFNAANFGKLLKSLLPSAATVILAFSILHRDWVVITHASRMTAGHFARLLGADVLEIAWKAALVMVIWRARGWSWGRPRRL